VSAKGVRRPPSGFTLIEVLISMLVLGVVMASALSLVRGQGRAFETGSRAMNTQQNVRYAFEVAAQQLRTAGSGVPDEQPFLVYAAQNVVAFNGNFASNVANDPFAVYYDRDARSGTVTAATFSQRFTIPNSGFDYPDTSYNQSSGDNSPAETIVLFFRLDSTTSRVDDYALFRSVNGQVPELVARDLLETPGRPFFQYLILRRPVSGAATLEPVPAATLPLSHSEPIHLAPADTGTAAMIDSVKAVRLSLTGTNGLTGAAERTVTLSRLIRMPNAGLAVRSTCGDQPLPAGSFGISVTTLASGDPAVSLSWTASVDEAGGERDVVRYAFWRREATESDWGDPYLSIPAGLASYAYSDESVQSGKTYYYAVASQDCTPSLSTRLTAGPAAIP